MTARSSTGLLLGLTVAMLSISQSELAIAQDEEIKDLSTVSCRDVLLAHGEERDGVILVLHAYLLGEAKQLTYDANELAEATDSFFDACLEDPAAQALGTLRNQIKAVSKQ